MNLLTLFGLFALAKSNCVDPSINEFAQDDPKLIKYISENLLSPPPPFPQHVSEMDLSIEEYDNVLGKKITIDVDYSALQGQYGQAPFIEELFKPLIKAENTTKRFYIEAGAFDGVKGSNTLRLELNPLWSGLLVEPNPELYAKTKSRERNAWTLPSCFSTKKRPEIVKFDAAGAIGGIINENNEHRPGDGLGKNFRQELTMQCVPFYSVIKALGNPTIDFMSLDIEGTELQVLKTIPFNQVDIRVLMIETNHIGEIFEGDNDDLRRFLCENDYVFYTRLTIDDIYIKKSFLRKLRKL